MSYSDIRTYDFAERLALFGHSSLPSSALGGVVRQRGLPFPRPLGLPRWGGLPLLSSLRWGGEFSSSSSSFSREEGVSDSSDDESDTTMLRALFRVPVVFFFLAFFSGTT